MNVEGFPVINATLNAASAVLLLAGYVLIKKRMIRAHVSMMLSAVVIGAAFLTCYLIYHANIGHKSSNLGLTPLGVTYYSILISHLILAIAMLPMIIMTLTRAYRRQWDRHRKIATPTFWIWLYVSVTGVIVYWMLYHLIPTIRP